MTLMNTKRTIVKPCMTLITIVKPCNYQYKELLLNRMYVKPSMAL